MLRYALAWQPHADNAGSDLLALAASRLLPKIDAALDADALDAPLNGFGPDDRIVTLIPGALLYASAHWPPDGRIAPVYAGVHLSSEDKYGLPLRALQGAGYAALAAGAPILCRDRRTAARAEALGLDHVLTGCLTLTLDRPAVDKDGSIVLCDVPEAVVQAVSALHDRVVTVTHAQPEPSADFDARMAQAEKLLRQYAAADMVFTRRLHCAMACLAVGTPVRLLYHPEYEDVERFAPMDSMVLHQPIDDFLTELASKGLPAPWQNPADMPRIRQTITDAVHEGVVRAEKMPLPIVPAEDAAAWRSERLAQAADRAAEKITDLESRQLDALVEKFSMLDREDDAKAAVRSLLEALGLTRDLPKNGRPKPRVRELEKLTREAWKALDAIGWPDGQHE